jgi:Asp-tRNA(Asn)/Glu-tRNA(Gln) amidotransferase C subunit
MSYLEEIKKLQLRQSLLLKSEPSKKIIKELSEITKAINKLYKLDWEQRHETVKLEDDY